MSLLSWTGRLSGQWTAAQEGGSLLSQAQEVEGIITALMR